MNFKQRLWIFWKALTGKNFCPGCNSDAPGIDDCWICEGWRGPYPPTDEMREKWAARYRAEGYRRTG